MLDVELRPRDPIIGKLVAFEAEVIHDGFPPCLVVLDTPLGTCSRCCAPN
jgi:hypothetical protein